MTEEYKENVLRQLTGQVEANTGNDRPIFMTTNNSTNAINQFIEDEGYNLNHSFYIKGTYSRNNQQLLFYEETQAGVFVSSFIIITDMDLNPIGIIKAYSGGTAFRQWDTFLEGDTGEGRIYFIDHSGSTYRLVYMSDPTSKKVGDEYKAEFLYSYTLNLDNTNVPFNLMKDPDNANFVISAYNSSAEIISFNELVINVGSSNEWNMYTYNTSVPGFSGDMSIYPIWSQELEGRLCFVDTDNGLSIKVLKTDNTNDTLSLVLQKTIDLPSSAQSYTNDIKGLTMKNYNYLYCYSQGLLNDDPTSHFFEVDLNAGTMKSLYSTPYYTYYIIQCINGIIFFTSGAYENGVSVVYFGMVSNGEYYDILLNGFESISPQTFIINSYNLYSIRTIDTIGEVDTLNKMYLIYNDLNYNGASFNDVNSVVSNSVVLNNENGQPIFARNLYNKTITQNTTESTVEIPAYQLNGINIAEQLLVSKNNNNIIYQYNDLEKNIYENVLMNFFNTLTIIDNNENKNKVMTNASNYFVNGLENGEYDDIKALRYRVTYTDNTTHTGTIGELSIEDNVATLGFIFYSGVGVSNLSILSNDETIIYATIDEEFDTNSYYKVVQEVEIN